MLQVGTHSHIFGFVQLSHTQTTHPNPAIHSTKVGTHTSLKYMPLPLSEDRYRGGIEGN